MGIGGQLDSRITARLMLAYTGVTRFDTTGWAHPHPKRWALDYIHHGRQRQRVRRGQPFTRLSGVAALYAPGCEYYEWRDTGGSLDESYIMFAVNGPVEAMLRGLTGRAGWCHVRDPEHVIGDRLRRIGDWLFHRQPGFELLAHGVFIELLGRLAMTQPVSPQQRVLRLPVPAAERRDLPGRVENFIRGHLASALRVTDIARHVGLSASALAHAYPALAGESPHRTIQRLKLEAAKRLLLQDGLSVKEAAGKLGFSSEFHFSRLFKRLEGIAPQQYRRALLKTGAGP